MTRSDNRDVIVAASIDGKDRFVGAADYLGVRLRGNGRFLRRSGAVADVDVDLLSGSVPPLPFCDDATLGPAPTVNRTLRIHGCSLALPPSLTPYIQAARQAAPKLQMTLGGNGA